MKSISQAEMIVMDLLWSDAPLPANAIGERLANDKQWNIRTVKTLLSRLVEKGILKTQSEGRRYLYSPALSREEYGAGILETVSQTFFKGRPAPLLLHLSKSQKFSDSDIEDISALLDILKTNQETSS